MMLVPLVFATAPQAFVAMVEQRISGTELHVTDWWADDLDGDHKPEAIAMVCEREHGFVLVLHGQTLLEAPIEIDGRNSCDVANRPAWTTRDAGTITENFNVHHGYMRYSLAIRDNKLALVGMSGHSFEHSRDGEDTEDDTVDYDALTWTHDENGTVTHGPLVLAAEHVHATTAIAGKTAITATWGADGAILHVHADRSMTIRDHYPMDDRWTVKVDKGDRDIPCGTAQIEVLASGTTTVVHIEHVDNDGRYPAPPKPWL